MGIDIVPLAYKHKLDISSPKAFAKDISKRFSANIIMKKEDEDYNIIEMFRLHHENAQHDISIIMKVITDEYKRLYEVSIDKKLPLTYTPIMLICILQNHPLDGMVLRLVFGIKIPQIILKS